MNAEDVDGAVARLAAAIGERARARMLYCLADGRARTSTELAAVAGVTPSTASVHLQRLKAERLVRVLAQGKHRFYSLDRPDVASALEALGVLAGGAPRRLAPIGPNALRAARACYDHIAGTLGVVVYDRLLARSWVSAAKAGTSCELTRAGRAGFEALGVDVESARRARRRFAFACLDWSERRPHLAGALGAALLGVALRRKWLVQDLDSRILRVTPLGRREFLGRLGLDATSERRPSTSLEPLRAQPRGRIA
jgi:DNA-binding transcriptional ArsR family regulator